LKPRYLQVFFGMSEEPPIDDRSRGRGLKIPWDLEKWKTSVFEYFTRRPNLEKSLEAIL